MRCQLLRLLQRQIAQGLVVACNVGSACCCTGQPVQPNTQPFNTNQHCLAAVVLGCWVFVFPALPQVEAVMNDFVRLREESSYHDTALFMEGGGGDGHYQDLMADDEDNYQLGECDCSACNQQKKCRNL